jgi:hypothetical protein
MCFCCVCLVYPMLSVSLACPFFYYLFCNSLTFIYEKLHDKYLQRFITYIRKHQYVTFLWLFLCRLFYDKHKMLVNYDNYNIIFVQTLISKNL